MPPAGKLEGQLDRYIIVFNRKSSIVKAIGLTTNEYYIEQSLKSHQTFSTSLWLSLFTALPVCAKALLPTNTSLIWLLP